MRSVSCPLGTLSAYTKFSRKKFCSARAFAYGPAASAVISAARPATRGLKPSGRAKYFSAMSAGTAPSAATSAATEGMPTSDRTV